MKIKITENNFNFILSEVEANLEPNFFNTIPNFDYSFAKKLLRKFEDVGYHYIGNWDSEAEMFNNLPKILLLVVEEIKSISERFSDNPKAEMTRTRTIHSAGDGMGEISPINSIIGSITTPSTKTVTKVDSTDAEVDPELVLKAYKANFEMVNMTDYFVYRVSHSVVEELNKYF